MSVHMDTVPAQPIPLYHSRRITSPSAPVLKKACLLLTDRHPDWSRPPVLSAGSVHSTLHGWHPLEGDISSD